MKVIVIGAGVSGLVAIKSCLEEDVEVICYELTDIIGGLWKYRDDSPEHVSVLQKSMVAIFNKEMCAFSDFPPPSHFPNFMPNRIMWSYLNLYAENFKLSPHIKFNHQVLSCEKSDSYEETGNWVLKGIDKTTGESWEDHANAVMVCNGHLARPYVPKIPGLDTFGGKIIHTRDYKTSKGYEDQNVVVIGVGNSGGDCAVELSTVTDKLYLSTRTGTWVLKRIGRCGLMGDFQINRFLSFLRNKSFRIISTFIEHIMNKNLDYELKFLRPKHKFLEQHPMVNDDLPNRIISGRIEIKDNVDHFTEHGVSFVGEGVEHKIDTVVMATGYTIHFPFLSDDIVNLNSRGKEIKLYKYILPPHLKHPTLGIIGLIQPLGSVMPLAEAQARWYCQLITGKMKLPTQEHMENSIQLTTKKHQQRFKQTTRYTLEVDWQSYIDDICVDFGAKPSLFRMMITDPRLFFKCLFGTIVPYQFRLNGPHSWSGAKEAIMTAEDRIKAPLVKSVDAESSFSIFNVGLASIFIGSIFLLYKLS